MNTTQEEPKERDEQDKYLVEGVRGVQSFHVLSRYIPPTPTTHISVLTNPGAPKTLLFKGVYFLLNQDFIM